MNSAVKVQARSKVRVERTYRATLQEVWDLWTTREGFESWWGPRNFRAAVAELDARPGGTLRYEMIAATPEMVRAMAEIGQPPSHAVTSTFAEVRPMSRLVLRNVIDFLPGVPSYEADIEVELTELGDRVKMVVLLDTMHSPEFTEMQKEGFTSQLSKLDEKFGAA
ncbi:SRPBCC family protein [Sorangium atrum]|uniref:SRPBCC domain-containing protein n=1 Tax=Sorangium atrum TaxID=2995308 RepID=A0ABT5BQ21_9BACT|nr:SRPBCC domain-containing protein [Sorangium aterium]MDC0676245.1 SRPBCC domain-containing protein [Sorangium aterium]